MMDQSAAVLGVMVNRFEAIVEEMAAIIVKAAYSAFVRETGDIGVVLLTQKGEVFACPHRIAEKRLGLALDPTLINDLTYDEGDIYISNDPRKTKGLSTHLPDLFLWQPVFVENDLLCFALGFVHTSDVGGIVAGSVSPNSVDLYQEGIIIPPVKLFSRGKLVEDVYSLIFTNTRIPENNWGDVKAVVGALRTGNQRMRSLVEIYGKQQIEDAMTQLLDLAEARARELIEEIPDGTYHFTDYLDGQPDGQPIRIELALTIEGSDVFFDFSGTSPQVRSSINVYTYEKANHWQLMRPFPDYFRTKDPHIPWNDGLLRPMHLQIPERTILNPTEDAAGGGRVITTWRIYYMTYGALAQAIPTQVPASGPAQAGVVLVSTQSPISRQRTVGVAEPLLGGGGARPFDDGHNATEFPGSYLKNIPLETLENEMKIKVLQYGLRRGSGGLGRQQGGLGVEFSFEALTPYTTISLRGAERHRFRAWGLLGGGPGELGMTVLERRGGTLENPGAMDFIVLHPGDRLSFASPGGGGYGSPLERDPEQVLYDLMDEYITAEQALEGYGVVIRDGNIDWEGTSHRRAEKRSVCSETDSLYSYGGERLAYEGHWDDQIHRMVSELASTLTLDEAQFLMEMLGGEVMKAMKAGRAFTVSDVQRISSDLLGRPVRLVGAR
jgi:N-methylhydantoinase B